MTGTLVNFLAIITGGLVGLFLKIDYQPRSN